MKVYIRIKPMREPESPPSWKSVEYAVELGPGGKVIVTDQFDRPIMALWRAPEAKNAKPD